MYQIPIGKCNFLTYRYKDLLSYKLIFKYEISKKYLKSLITIEF